MSNLGHHAPETKITPYTLHERMAAYDRLPRLVRDAFKDVPCKLECVGTDDWCAFHGSAGDTQAVQHIRDLGKKVYDACYLDVFGEVPGAAE